MRNRFADIFGEVPKGEVRVSLASASYGQPTNHFDLLMNFFMSGKPLNVTRNWQLIKNFLFRN